jgi:hypothetical protein
VATGHGYEVSRACKSMCRGTLPLDAPCDGQLDCAPIEGARVSCGVTDVAGAPKCLRQTCGKIGDPCFDTCLELADDEEWGCLGPRPFQVITAPGGSAACYLDDGLFCGTDRTCHEFLPVGEPCTHYDVCVRNARCDSETATCRLPVEIGSPCVSIFPCAPFAYCSSAGVCEQRKLDGEACASTAECEHPCDGATQRCGFGLEQYVSDMTAACANPWKTGTGLFHPP